MPGFSLSERYLHPEGMYSAQIESVEDKPGNYGPQLKWTFTTTEVKENGEPAQLSYFTGKNFSSDDRNKLCQLLRTLGVSIPETREEAEAFNEQDLVGCVCRVTVIHKPSSDGTLWANIDRVLSAATKKPAPAAAPAASGFKCEKCEKPLTKIQHDVSMRMYEAALCLDHQREITEGAAADATPDPFRNE